MAADNRLHWWTSPRTLLRYILMLDDTPHSIALGTAIGLAAGYLGGRADHVLMRAVEVLMAFPTLLLALAVVATLGGSLRNLVLAISLAYIPIFSRVVRGSVLSVKHLEYVQAARALGSGDLHIMVRQILPNVTAPITVQATFNLSTAIMIEAALSFLGLGVQPPAPSCGKSVNSGIRTCRTRSGAAVS